MNNQVPSANYQSSAAYGLDPPVAAVRLKWSHWSKANWHAFFVIVALRK